MEQGREVWAKMSEPKPTKSSNSVTVIKPKVKYVILLPLDHNLNVTKNNLVLFYVFTLKQTIVSHLSAKISW